MKKLKAFAALLLIVSSLFSQNATKQVKGKVLDEGGKPLSGANVTLSGGANKKGSQTDATGSFSIYVPTDGKKYDLLISYVGYVSQLVPATDGVTVKLLSSKDVTNDEVVVIGYQSVRRKDMVGAVSTVSAKQIKDIPSNSAADALTGRIAGVQIVTDQGQPGSDFTIKARGGGSITQDNAPLYIIDGIQVENGLASIAPQDIESIDFLKDAAATSIYGARGANGVMVITTKGGKNTGGKTTITYNGLVGFAELPKELKVMDPYNFVEYQWERDHYLSPQDSDVVKMYAPVWDSVARYKNYPATDWQHLVFGQKALLQTHNVSMSGGTAATQFNLSLTDNEQEGIMINTSFSRQLVNFRLDHKVNDKLKVGFNARYNTQVVAGSGTTNGETTTGSNVQSYSNLRQSVKYTPILPIGADPKTYNSAYFIDNTDASSGNGLSLINPIMIANQQYRKNYTNVINVNGYLNYSFTPQISFRSTAGFDQNTIRQDAFDDTITIYANKNNIQPIASITNATRTTINNSNVLTYSNALSQSSFARHNSITALIGQEVYLTETKGYSITSKYFPAGINATTALANMNLVLPPTGAPAQPLPTSSDVKTNIASFFGRLNYEYDKRYSASASLRADGSSIFSSEKRWGYFPSASLGWKISNERFMAGVNKLSDVRLRLSYGSAGNNRIPPFQYLTQFVTSTGTAASTSSVNYGLNNGLYTGLAAQALANQYLQWEVTHSSNLGLDFTLYKRFVFTIDAYLNYTDKLLINNPSLPPSTGYTSQYQNIGKTSNKGVEFQVAAPVVQNNRFIWNANFNVSFNTNKIESIGGVPPIYISSGALGTGVNDFVIQTGQPVGAMYGYLSDGFYKVNDFNYNATSQTYTLKAGVANNAGATGIAPQPGGMKFRAPNGDSAIGPNSRTIIGNPNPKFFGGLNQQFTYKNFDASVFVNFSYGGKIMNANKIEFSSAYTPGSNMLADFTGRWRNVDDGGNLVKDPVALAALNKNATIWIPTPSGSANAFLPTSWAIEDASFIRINNITIGYTLPAKVISKIWISKLRIFATANNVAVITGYSGYDPEVNTRRATPATPSVDYSAYPRNRSFVFGVNASF